MSENCARLGAACVEQRDTATALPSDVDRILIDVPCSNTGVMRRRVDLRWRLKPDELQRLVTTQLDLLRKAAGLVKPGGSIVYSTCSLEPEENGGLVRRFITESKRFELEDEQEVNPVKDTVDGAYAASIKRIR